MYKLIMGDCIEEMKKLEDESVDLILTDPPYGTIKGRNRKDENGKIIRKRTDWDEVVDIPSMLEEFQRVLKPNGRALIFGNNTYTQKLRGESNSKMKYSYPLYWYKNHFGSPLNAKKAPLSYIEDITVFTKQLGKKDSLSPVFNLPEGKGHVPNIFEIAKDNYGGNSFHPTQKPVELMRQLIEIYSNEGDVVLDAFMGSGTTGVACIQTDRKFIGIELDEEYFNISKNRIEEEIQYGRENQ